LGIEFCVDIVISMTTTHTVVASEMATLNLLIEYLQEWGEFTVREPREFDDLIGWTFSGQSTCGWAESPSLYSPGEAWIDGEVDITSPNGTQYLVKMYGIHMEYSIEVKTANGWETIH